MQMNPKLVLGLSHLGLLVCSGGGLFWPRCSMQDLSSWTKDQRDLCSLQWKCGVLPLDRQGSPYLDFNNLPPLVIQVPTQSRPSAPIVLRFRIQGLCLQTASRPVLASARRTDAKAPEGDLGWSC